VDFGSAGAGEGKIKKLNRFILILIIIIKGERELFYVPLFVF
jgi:hypothetical protein